MSDIVTLRNKETGEVIKLRKKSQEQAEPQEQPQEQAGQQERPSIISQLLRFAMRSSPLEQMKTTQSLQQQGVPDVQGGQSLQSYQQGIAQQLQPREQEIAGKGTLSQLEAPIMAGLAVSGASAPMQTAKALGKFGLLEGLMNVSGINKGIEGIQQPELRDLADMAKVGLEGAVAMKPWELPKSVKTAETKLAGRIVDSLIKPRHKEFMFGRNPGEAIAKEGIVANNLGSLKDKVQLRLDDIMKGISEVRSNAENFDKRINASETLQPLTETYTKLKSYGAKTHSAELQRLTNSMEDIVNSGKDLKDLSVSEAYQLKEAVSSMQNWESNSEASKAVNGAIRRVYHNIDSVIDKTIPQLKSLNERVSNLISAKQAIDNRIEILRKSEPMPTLFKLLDLPFAASKTPLAKTGLANLLAEKYSGK